MDQIPFDDDSMEDRRSYDAQIADLRRELHELKEQLQPVIEVWSSLTGLVHVLQWVGIVVKWLVGIAIPIAAWWATMGGNSSGKGG